ncbi:universal stress protein [Flaviaesturariibacter terrae]
MERILLLLNANRPDISCIDFACRVADFHKAFVSGILVENMLEEESSSHGSRRDSDVISMDTDQAVRIFEDTCIRKGLEQETLLIDGGPLPFAVRESHFADLIILSPETTFSTDGNGIPSTFTRDLLRSAACPVMLAPREFDGISETIFCYDGSPSSLFAIKLYTYLFPGLCGEKLTILEVTRSEDALLDEAQQSLLKWARCHYEDVRFQTLVGDAREELLQYLFMKRGKMVVLGAFGRSLLSMLFHESTAERLTETVDLPMFITHL